MTVFAAEATSVATSTTSYDTRQRQVAYETSATRLQLDTIRSLFNAKEYAAMYPDVVKELGNNEEALWNHFVTYGFSEGRSMNKNFNVFAYRACYEDLQKAFGDDLFAYYEHYIQFGQNEHRKLITIDAAKKAGITVVGMNGKDLTNPTSSLSGSLARGVKPKVTPKPRPSASASPKSSASPKATASPTVKPTASPSVSPSASPTPGVHDHDYALVRSNGDGTHTFSCSICGLKDPSRTNVACTYGSLVGKDGGHSSNCIVCNHQSPVEPCTPKYTPVEDTTEDGKRVELHNVSCLVCHTPYKDSTGNDLVNSCVDTDNNGECDYCKGTVEKKHVHEFSEYIQIHIMVFVVIIKNVQHALT